MLFSQTADERKVRVFSLSQSFLDQFEGKQPAWGPVGYFTYKRTYARDLPEGGTEEFWQTCQRVVEGCFNIQKAHCRQMGLPWQEQKAQGSAQDMFRRMWDFKFSPPGRGLWMMGTEYVNSRGAAALQNCFAGGTEIITVEGVKQIGPLAGTVQTLLTKNGKWVDAPIRSFGRQRLWRLTLTRQGVEKTLYVTGDHRWFAKDRRQVHRDNGHTEFKTKELRPEVHRLQYVFGQGIKGNVQPSPFGIAHGFVYGDGRTAQGGRNANSVPLIGDKDAALKPYFSMCPSWNRDDGVEYGAIPNAFRRLPSLQENKSYLLGWLMGYFAADGTCSGGPAVLSSHLKSDIEFARDVCVLLGIGVYSIQEDTRISNLTDCPHTMYRMALMRDTLVPDFFLIPSHRESYEAHGAEVVTQRHWTVKFVEETDRDEEVFCATVEEQGAFALEGNILTGNCAFTSTDKIAEDFAAPFCFLMDLSMLGVGVGADTRGAGLVKIIVPKMTEEPLVVEDSREGWVALVHTILNSFVGKSHYPATIDYTKVRGRGVPIKTFGGVASGPKPLQNLVEGVTRILMPKGAKAIFEVPYDDATGKIEGVAVRFEGSGEPYRISSAQIVDVFNFIGKCVVAGGVRRTAEIMFGEPDDQEFITLKQDKEALEDRRWASNNSVFAYVGMDYSDIAKSIAVNGEPGLLWIKNSQAFSRMADSPDNRDWRVKGTNPCGEQPLESFELCNLVETYPAHHDSYEDFERTLKMAYLYAKTVTLVPTHDLRANAVMTRNRRIGCSMSGIVQAIGKLGRRQFLNWCDQGYKYIQKLDRTYSEWLGTPASIKTTTVKPSGTVSLLCGATPGIHYPHSEFYIRHIRVANTSPLVEAARKAGYTVVPDTYADDTSVIAFPVREKHFVKGKASATLWEQFALAADMQRYWADNQVSVTVTFKPEEARDVQSCLETFEDKLKGVSMLPLHDEDHGYRLAPYVAITGEQYEAMVARVSPIVFDTPTHDASAEEKFCTGDRCEIPLPAKK